MNLAAEQPAASFPPLSALVERAGRRGEARRRFSSFLSVVGKDDRGDPLRREPHSDAIASTMAYAFEQGKHFACVTPPGLCKSTIARLFLCYLIGKNTSARSVIISGDETSAADGVGLCREIVLSDEFRDVFPEARPDFERSKRQGVRDERGWRRDGWFLEAAGQRKDPTMAAVAAIPKREDMRVDYHLADDIVTERIAQSTAERTAIERAFFNTWLEGRLSNGGWCCYLQNMRRSGDLAHQLRDDPRFVSLWVGVTEDCERLFLRVWNAPEDLPLIKTPARFGLEPVESTVGGASHEWYAPLPKRAGWRPDDLASRNPAAFRQLYRLLAAAPEDLVFPHFEACRQDRMTYGQCAQGGFEFDAGTAIAAGLDWSGGKRRGKALSILARRSGVTMPVFFSQSARSVQDVIALLDAAWKMGIRWHVLVAESNAVQDELNNALRLLGKDREWSTTVVDFTTTAANKHDPVLGLGQLDVAMETGAFVWPDQTARERSEWRVLAEAFATTDRQTISTPGKTPDSVMATWFAWHGLRRVCVQFGDFPVKTAGVANSRGALRRF